MMEEKVFELLEKLADKLGTTVEHSWAILVKQAFIRGITLLIGTCIAVSIITVFLYNLRYFVETAIKEEKKYLVIISRVFLVVGGITFLFAVAFLMDSCSEIITNFFNPEYYALNKILSLIK